MNIWPWNKLGSLRQELRAVTDALEMEREAHRKTLGATVEMANQLADLKAKDQATQKHVRKMTSILALKGGIMLWLLTLSLSLFAQPVQRNPVTTNLLGNAAGTTYFLGWNGTIPQWKVPAGGGTNFWDYNGSFIFPIFTTGVSNVDNFYNGGGDISANATNNDNRISVNISNYVATISQNATNEALRQATAITNGAILNLSNYVNTISINATNQATVVSNGITGRLIKSLGVTIDGGGQVLTSGAKGYLEVPVGCTIISARIMADQSGSIAIETWRTNTTVGNFPPTRAGAMFTNYLTTTTSSLDSTFTGNTSLTLATQDILGFNVTTNALSVTRVTLQLRVQP